MIENLQVVIVVVERDHVHPSVDADHVHRDDVVDPRLETETVHLNVVDTDLAHLAQNPLVMK